MNQIKKVFLIVIAALSLAAPALLVTANSAYAAGSYTCQGGGLSIPSCQGTGVYTGDTQHNPIVLWMVFFINTISAVIGLGAILMIIVAGIQYSSAGDNAATVQAAKKKITNVFIGLAVYISFYALMNWIIPGGVL
jgi:hypothetical protein